MWNQLFYYNMIGQDCFKMLQNFLEFVGSDYLIILLFFLGVCEVESYYDIKQVYILVNKQEVFVKGVVSEKDIVNIVDVILFNLQFKDYMIKDELVILDVIGSNFWDCFIYFVVMAWQEKFFGLDDYM